MKHIRLFLTVALFGIVFSLGAPPVFALKKFAPKAVAPKSMGSTFSSARLSRPTNSIILQLHNLTKVTKIEYVLTYTANGVNQGAMGSVKPSGSNTESRDLYLGTCSKGVCTPHRNITNATLTVTATLTSGATNVKRYRIRI